MTNDLLDDLRAHNFDDAAREITLRDDLLRSRDHDIEQLQIALRKDRAEIDRLRSQRNEKAQEIVGWKRTALAMRDQAIYWEQDGKSRYDEIERMYFDAAMFNKFTPGDAFAHEREVKK